MNSYVRPNWVEHLRWRVTIVAAAVWLCLGAINGTATAESPTSEADKQLKPGEKWIRILRDDQGNPTAMQTAIVRYAPREGNEGATVDLVGAVHVADRAYYEKLNKLFEDYDALLYELVAPEGTRVPKGGGEGSGHPVAALQTGMKDMLELDHQLQVIDYTKDNFVHADMSPDQFSKAMQDRGESFVELFFRMMGQGIAQQSRQQAQGKSTDLALITAMFAEDRAMRLKKVMAEQFEDMEQMMVGIDGPDGTTLITGRNQAALKVLRKNIDDGKKRLGIFYGAGHLPDMDKRLREEFNLQPVEVRWLTAWDMSADE
jgi:hypothetical protein